MDLLEGLNAAQREAVTTTEGFVRVIAGAGSGKTRALTRRFAYLVTELGILPGNLLCVTFTNKAANEMRQRIHNLTGDNDTGYINTFHGFCVSILQEDSHAVGYPKSFLVLDNSDIDAMLRIIRPSKLIIGCQFHTVLDHQARGLNLIGIIDIKKVRIDCRQHISAVQRRSLGLIRGGLLQALFQRLLVIRRTCNKRQILVCRCVNRDYKGVDICIICVFK